MNMIILFLATAGSGQGGNQSSPMGMLLPLILIFGIMYLLIFRPQAKKQKEHRMMLETLQKGDKVITAGGIIGTIAGIRDKGNIIILQIAKDVKIEVTKGSIARKLTNVPAETLK